MSADDEKSWGLYARAWDRLEGRSSGFGMPIIRHLAMRGHTPSLIVLSEAAPWKGRPAEARSSMGLAYRAFRLGDPLASQNLAMSCFNRGDLTGYRRWLARAAQAGDPDSPRELERFETRLPHGAA